MIRNDEAGLTLIELIIAMAVASITAGILFVGYTTVGKLWNEYFRRIEASDGAWKIYLTIERTMTESYSVKKKNMNRWLFYRNRHDSLELIFENRTLYFIDSIKNSVSDVDSFHLDVNDTSGIYPVWECSFIHSRKKKKSGMAWRTLCRENYISDTIPLSFMPTFVHFGLYWDEKQGIIR